MMRNKKERVVDAGETTMNGCGNKRFTVVQEIG